MMSNSRNLPRVDKADPTNKPNAAFRGIPTALASRRSAAAWVVWEWTWNGKRWDKPPRRSRDFGSASTADAGTWSLAEQAVNAVSSRDAGVGYVLAGDADLVVLDLDNVIDISGAIEPWAAKLIADCDSYTEASPSGCGFKVFGTGRDLGSVSKRISMPLGEVEIFHNTRRYVTITGVSDAPERALRDLSKIVEELISTAARNTPTAAAAESVHLTYDGPRQIDVVRALEGWFDPDSYADWVEAALALHSEPWGLEVWLRWAARSPKFKHQENMAKWAATIPSKGISPRSILRRVPSETLADWARAQAGKSGFDVGKLKIFNPENAECTPTYQEPANWLKPFAYRPPETVPRRRWLYGSHYIRRFVTVTIAPGGVGKSSLALAEALSMSSGRPLLGTTPNERCRVGYFNGEDPAEETERRVLAAISHYGLAPEDVEGWLHVGSGRDQGLKLAEQNREGLQSVQSEVAKVIAAIRNFNLDVVILDPFIRTHAVGENDNAGIDLVLNTLGKIAEGNDVAIEVVHHTRKKSPGSGDVEIEDSRGASALLSAARSARVLNVMSEAEAGSAGVEVKREYFKVTNGKANLAPPPARADWYHLVGVDLGNGPIGGGDTVAVVTPWCWPNAFEGLTASDTYKVQQVVAAGDWRDSPQSTDWVGYAVAKALGLDVGPSRKTDQRPEHRRARGRIQTLLQIWRTNEVLATELRNDAKRMPRKFVVVGQWVAP